MQGTRVVLADERSATVVRVWCCWALPTEPHTAPLRRRWRLRAVRTRVSGMCANTARATQRNLLAGADVNFAMQNGATALFIAAEEGHTGVVHALLKAKASVDQTTVNGATALLIAAQNGHLEVALALLDAGADLAMAASNGMTPLLAATRKAHLEVVGALLRGGAPVDEAMANGATPLIVAAIEGNADVVEVLLRGRAQVSVHARAPVPSPTLLPRQRTLCGVLVGGEGGISLSPPPSLSLSLSLSLWVLRSSIFF